MSLDLGADLVLLKRNPVALLLRRPEPRHREPVLQVRAEVVHVPDGEGEVETELDGSMRVRWGGRWEGHREGKSGTNLKDLEVGAS